jgi:hypothetical protein
MTEPIWDSSALSEADRFSYSVKYTGNSPSGLSCICGTSSSSAFLIRALTSQCGGTRIGAFEIQINLILNPTEYANGEEKVVRLSETVRIPVFQISASLLIPFDSPPKCYHLIVAAVYDAFHSRVTVLDSIHASLLIGSFPIPSLLTLSETTNDPAFGIANTIGGLAAGLLVYAKVYGVECRVLEVVEDDFGPSRESIALWLSGIEGLVAVAEPEAVLAEAVRLAGFRSGTFCGIYS